MKGRVLTLLLVAAALAAGGLAYSASTPTGLPNHDAVFGGGQFPFISGTSVRNFSLTARADGERGEGTLQYSTGSIRLEITCARVSGNAAVVGGIVRSSTATTAIGLPAIMYFVDNGPPAGQAVGGDLVSPLGIFGVGEDAGGLPKTCPAVDASQATQLLYAGDVVVHDKEPGN